MGETRRIWERLDENKVVYKTLYNEMRKRGYSATRMADEIGVAHYQVCRKLRGEIQWKLWEAMAAWRILQTGLTVEELFQEVDA